MINLNDRVINLTHTDGPYHTAGESHRFATNLGGVNYFSATRAFIDWCKQSTHYLANDPIVDIPDHPGWKLLPEGSSLYMSYYLSTTAIDTKMPAGDFVVTWDGDHLPAMDVLSGTTMVANSPSKSGTTLGDWRSHRVEFSLPVHLGNVFALRLYPGVVMYNIRVFKKEHESLLAQGEIFDPNYIADLMGYKVIRFMDWMSTNRNYRATASDWADISDKTARYYADGCPIDVMCKLGEKLGWPDLWFCIPARAKDDLVHLIASQIRANIPVGACKAYIEYGNEIWNTSSPFGFNTDWVSVGGWDNFKLVGWDTDTATLPNHDFLEGEALRFQPTNNTARSNSHPLSYANGTRFAKNVTQDTFQVANGADELETDPSGAPILLRKYDIPWQTNDEYCKRLLEIWDICEQYLGTDLYKVCATMWAGTTNYTAPRMIYPGMKVACDAVAIAPYAYEDASLLPDWGTNTVEALSDNVTANFKTQFPSRYNSHASHGVTVIVYEAGEHLGGRYSNMDEAAKIVEWARSESIKYWHNWYYRFMSSYGLKDFCNFSAHSRFTSDGCWGLMEGPRDITHNKYLGCKEFIDAGAVPARSVTWTEIKNREDL